MGRTEQVELRNTAQQAVETAGKVVCNLLVKRLDSQT
jgi:hypothetical protein